MSAPAGVPGRRRGLVLASLIGLGALLLGLLVAGPPADDVPLDPTSGGPSGLRGTVELLEQLGVEVTISLEPPSDTATRVFVPLDLLSSTRRDAFRDWVRAGGTLVVAGTDTGLHDLAPSPLWLAQPVGPVGRVPACPAPALAEVDEVVHARWATFEIPDDGPSDACFAGDGVAWLVAVEEGDGTVVALGSADPFVNARLDDADNAVLAAALFGPGPGERLVVVPRPPVGEGEAGLADLVPDRAWHVIALLFVALVLGVTWRARRLGRPVPEALPPVIPSAELARSVSRLLERTGSRQDAAERLRRDARTAAIRALGLPAVVGDEVLVDLAAARLGVSASHARAAFVAAPVEGDGDLVAVARAVRRIHVASGQWQGRPSSLSIHRPNDKKPHRSHDTDSGART